MIDMAMGDQNPLDVFKSVTESSKGLSQNLKGEIGPDTRIDERDWLVDDKVYIRGANWKGDGKLYSQNLVCVFFHRSILSLGFSSPNIYTLPPNVKKRWEISFPQKRENSSLKSGAFFYRIT